MSRFEELDRAARERAIARKRAKALEGTGKVEEAVEVLRAVALVDEARRMEKRGEKSKALARADQLAASGDMKAAEATLLQAGLAKELPKIMKRADEARARLRAMARNLERAGRYEDCAKILEKLGEWDEAGRVRRAGLPAPSPGTTVSIGAVVGGSVAGDVVQGRAAVVKDSVLNRSNIGAPTQATFRCVRCEGTFIAGGEPKFCPFCRVELAGPPLRPEDG